MAKKKSGNKKFTPRKRKFALEYLIDKNARQAAIRAGYSTKTADQIAYGLLQETSVKEFIDKELKAQEDRTRITADRVLEELGKIAFSDISQIFNEDGTVKNFEDIPAEVRAMIAGIDTDELNEGFGKDREVVGQTRKVRFWDKVRALELIGKKFKMFTDKHEHSGSVDSEITHKFGEEEKESLLGLAKSIVKSKASSK